MVTFILFVVFDLICILLIDAMIKDIQRAYRRYRGKGYVTQPRRVKHQQQRRRKVDFYL